MNTKTEYPVFESGYYAAHMVNGRISFVKSKYATDSVFMTLVLMIDGDSDVFENVMKLFEENGVSWEMIVDQCIEEIKDLSDMDMQMTMNYFMPNERDTITNFRDNFNADDYTNTCFGKMSKNIKRRIIDNVSENIDLSANVFVKKYKTKILEVFADYLKGDADDFRDVVEKDLCEDSRWYEYTAEFTCDSIADSVNKEIGNILPQTCGLPT